MKINAIIELRNVIYKGYDPDFDLYNLGFSFNSCCVYRGKYSGLEHKYPSYSKHMDLDSGSDIKVDLRFSLPPYFYDNLPPRVKDLIGKI